MAFSDAHSPVYYTGKTKAAIPHFKRSVNYLKFKQEYEQSIQSIIDFYNQHAPNLGQDEITTDLPESLRKKSTVENMFMQFKMALFDVKNFDRLHHLYQAKRPIEEIAQSLQEEGSIPTVTKLDEIRELARKIMMCGSGVHSHIIGTKLSLTGSSGELSDNFSAYKNTIAHAVITESTSRHFINPFYEIHVFNEYWNHFSKILGIASIEDKSYANFFTNGADIQACQNALQQALTPFNITDKLATDHWNNLRSVIGDATEWGQINDILAGLKSSYKPINVYSLIEESVDSPDKYRLRQDKTWLQVEIARQLSLLPSQISWLNWTPIAVEGNRLLRIGDLFWQEIDGELSPPKIEDLVGYAGQVAYAQLIDGIARAKEQDAIWLSELDPQYLQVTNTKDIALFFSKLGDERFIRYAMNNLNWFKKLTVPAPLLIKTLSKISDGEVANIDTGFLYSMSLKEIKKFFEYWESNAIKPWRAPFGKRKILYVKMIFCTD
ncbi:hypothetical protein [Candidatus Fukatsuia symbiotica]|nr:hypothetical protein [Candidatus Fukatsuia symbiotica]